MNKPEHLGDQSRPKRIAIYVIFDKDGILDGFRKYYLEKLREVTDCIVAVVNGTLTPESRDELEKLTDDFFVRENTGLLAYGWIEGIRHIGWETLAEYDELLMLNDSFFGPFYPLSELMDAAEKSDADFYGAMKNFEEKNTVDLAGHGFKHGYLRGSICYFYIIKSRLLHSAEFQSYWGNVPAISNDWDTYFFNEFDFYDYVRDAGFKIDAYQGDDLKGYCYDSLSQCMYKLVKDERIPFARVRPFGSDMLSQALQIGYGKDPRKTLEYIDKCTDYDTNLIWDYLLRTRNLSDIYHQLQLGYVVQKNSLESSFDYDKRIAVILHIYYDDLAEKMAWYCQNFPDKTDFYITTTTEKTRDAIHEAFDKYQLHYECTIRPNVGVAMSSLWVTYANVITGGEYEYIFYFHDKKSPYTNYGRVHGEQFGVRCYENLVGTPEIVRNIINLFEANPRMGVLGVPIVYHGEYYSSALRCWPGNYQNTVSLADRLGLHVILDPSVPPVAPYGDMFWFRADALKKAVGCGLTYDDFDVPYAVDFTFMHAVERIYGYAAQDSGYYYADVLNSDDARSDLVNYQYILDKLSQTMLMSGQYPGTFEAAKEIIRHYPYYNPQAAGPLAQPTARIIVKDAIKRRIPKPIWRFMKKTYHVFGGKKWVG